MPRVLPMLFFACASQSPVTVVAPPTVIRVIDERCLSAEAPPTSVEQATKVFDAFRADIAAQVPIEPLRAPKSLDDVLEILRRDQIDLFAHGVDFARGDPSTKARVLEAQLELAWGEALVMVAQVLERQLAEAAFQSLRQRARAAIGQVSGEEQKSVQALSEKLQSARKLIDAMWVLAPMHIERGAALAQKLLQSAPNDYHGYRVAADYYRLRADWPSFDKMIEEVGKRKPDSTGLAFLLGVAAMDRFGNREVCAKKLSQALVSDPKFAKAQAMLLILADTPKANHEALEKLRAINPTHQLVVLVGPTIEASYEAWKAQGGGQPGMNDL